MRIVCAILVASWLQFILAQSVPIGLTDKFGQVSMGMNEQIPSFLEAGARSAASDGVSIINEFPTPEYCGSTTASWKMVEQLKDDMKSNNDLSYLKIVKDRDLINKYYRCPLVNLTDPLKPEFRTCCAYGSIFLTYTCVKVEDDVAQSKFVPQLNKWLAAVERHTRTNAVGAPPHPSEFIHISCPSLSSVSTTEKVCSSKFDCKGLSLPASNSKTKVVDAQCCWSAGRHAPGFCSQTCGRTRYEVLGRCDVAEDCQRVAILEGNPSGLVCCHDPNTKGRSEQRRGFCAETCGTDQDVMSGCGLDNKCELTKNTLQPNAQDGKGTTSKCCQSMRPSMASLPNRSCKERCLGPEEDITGLDTPLHIAAMTAKQDATAEGTDEFSRSGQMQRFAQLSARALENPLEFQKVLDLGKRNQLIDHCNLLPPILPPMARHIVNSVLLTFSPFVVMDTVRPTPEESREMLKRNFKTIHDLKVDTELARLLNLNSTLPSEFGPVAELVRKFQSGPSDLDARKLDGGDLWWNTQFDLFKNAVDVALALCKQAIVDAGAGTADDEPDYLAMVSYLRDFDNYHKSVADWDTPIRKEAYERARVCYSTWTRARSGLFYYGHKLAKENEKSMAMLATGMKFMTGIGTALTPLTFGLGGVVTSAIEFVVGKTAGADKEKQRVAVGTLTNVFEETMAEVPAALQKECETTWMNRETHLTAERVCNSKNLLPEVQKQVNYICDKHIKEVKKQISEIESSVGKTKSRSDKLEAEAKELKDEIERRLAAPPTAQQTPAPTTPDAPPAPTPPATPATPAQPPSPSPAPAPRRVKKETVWERLSRESASHGIPRTRPSTATATATAASKPKRPNTRAPSALIELDAPDPAAVPGAVLLKDMDLPALQDRLAQKESEIHMLQQLLIDRKQRSSEARRNLQHIVERTYKEFFNVCVFDVALDSHFEALKVVYKQLLSVYYCRSSEDWEGTRYFKEHVVGLTPSQSKLLRAYAEMLEDSSIFSIVQTIAGVTQNSGLSNQLYIKEQKWMSTDVSTAPAYFEKLAHASHTGALFALDTVTALVH